MNNQTMALTPERLKEIEERAKLALKVYANPYVGASIRLHSASDIPDLLTHIAEQGKELLIANGKAQANLDCIPAKCPITQRPFFMVIEHPELGLVPTYGGPFDSYTIPQMGEVKDGTPWHEIELYEYRYDHDEGGWVDGTQSTDLRLISEQGALMDFYEKEDEIKSLKQKLESQDKKIERLREAVRVKDGLLARVEPATLGRGFYSKSLENLCSDIKSEAGNPVSQQALSPNFGGGE